METPPEGSTTLTMVETAARAAAHQVLTSPATKRRQFKLVALACCLSVVAVLSLALPTAYFLDRDRVGSAVERARFNCDQQAEATAIHRDILQIGTDLRRDTRKLGRAPDVQAAVLEVFGAKLVERLYIKQAALERKADRKWAVKLAALRRLSRLDCDEVIVKSGVKTTSTPGSATKTTR